MAALTTLTAVKPLVEEESEKCGRRVEFPPVAAVLLADQQRRLSLRKAGKAPPPWTHAQSDYWDPRQALRRDLVKHFEQIGDDSQVVPELIRLLEELDEPLTDLLVDRLVGVGNDAVEPLLDCLQNDRRLARNVSDRSVTYVAELAFKALEGTLQTDFTWIGGMFEDTHSAAQERKALAAEARAFWKKVKGLPLAERWYLALADDAAPARDWLDAADAITLPADRSGRHFPALSAKQRKPGQPVFHGDVLRDRRNPSVAELMIRRVETLSGRKKGPDDWPKDPLNQACEIAFCLAHWDLKVALPVLRRQMQRCRDAVAAHGRPEVPWGNGWATHAAHFAVIRAEAGNRHALDEYAAWIRGTTPQALAGEFLPVLEPLWRFPREKPTKELADWLFLDPASPWNPLGRSERIAGYFDDRAIRSRLVAVPAFRQLLLKLLADKRAAGDVRECRGQIGVTENGVLHEPSGGTRGVWDARDPRCPPKGTVVPIRVCNLVAADLQLLDGMTHIEPLLA